MESNEKIPFIGRVLNGLYYNFWQDENHVQGIWRRCTLDEYRKPEPVWERAKHRATPVKSHAFMCADLCSMHLHTNNSENPMHLHTNV